VSCWAAVVGRQAGLAAALIVAVAANLALGLSTGRWSVTWWASYLVC